MILHKLKNDKSTNTQKPEHAEKKGKKMKTAETHQNLTETKQAQIQV